MKPTRNIVQPSGFWKTKRKVWCLKNDDSKLGRVPTTEEGKRTYADMDSFIEHVRRREEEGK